MRRNVNQTVERSTLGALMHFVRITIGSLRALTPVCPTTSPSQEASAYSRANTTRKLLDQALRGRCNHCSTTILLHNLCHLLNSPTYNLQLRNHTSPFPSSEEHLPFTFEVSSMKPKSSSKTVWPACFLESYRKAWYRRPVPGQTHNH